MGGFPVCWNAILCGSARTLHLFSMFRFDLFSARFAARPRSVDKRGLQLGQWFLPPGASRWPIADQEGLVQFQTRRWALQTTAWNAGTTLRRGHAGTRRDNRSDLAMHEKQWPGACSGRLAGDQATLSWRSVAGF